MISNKIKITTPHKYLVCLVGTRYIKCRFFFLILSIWDWRENLKNKRAVWWRTKAFACVEEGPDHIRFIVKKDISFLRRASL